MRRLGPPAHPLETLKRRFYFGHAAMLVNEGLPNYIVSRLRMRCDLATKVVGVLGMAFKGNSDDGRDSLSYKLRKVLAFESRLVLCSDPYICDNKFVSEEELIRQCDIIVLAAPHGAYKTLKIPSEKIVVDVWNFWGNGCRI